MSRVNSTLSNFIPFTTNVSQHSLPERFTFPYYYSPHPLACVAIEELQAYLESQQWAYDFSISGKMFGVLVVQDSEGALGYLTSYAGGNDSNSFDSNSFVSNSAASNNHGLVSQDPSLQDASERFVKPVFERKDHSVLFDSLENEIRTLGLQINKLKDASKLTDLKREHAEHTRQADLEISHFQLAIAESKKQRKLLRKSAESNLGVSVTEQQIATLVIDLGNQSSREKRELKALKNKWQETLEAITQQLDACVAQLEEHEAHYQQLSDSLIQAEREACQFLNQHKHFKNINELFLQTDSHSVKSPIDGASEQNLPKLLQAAFQLNLAPIALGEFWWGASPYHQIRQHKNLYPVCQSKCYEILEHMLDGVPLDESPLEQTPSEGKVLEIIYEDESLVVVNKPAEFLSVSGKYIDDSVHARIQARYPDATGPLIVHRLDMSTSGLLVLALTPESNKQLQRQFIERTVEKRYTALLEGILDDDVGLITLPLRGDMEDRPRQMVCHENGRYAETSYEVVEKENNRTKVHLYPKTGRTHQLRVHCAYQAGLNTPIVGDDLYGFKQDRLYLHAGYLKFTHPVSGDSMEFEVKSDF